MKTKLCRKCDLIKPINDFAHLNRAKDTRQCYCRACSNKMGLANYFANKERYFLQAKKRDKQLDKLINSYKNKPCADCGIQYPPFVMDFDHTGEAPKEYNISYMRRHRMAFKKIVAEIAKCEVVCANCHRIRTNFRQPARYPH